MVTLIDIPTDTKATLTNIPTDTKAAFTDIPTSIKGSTLIRLSTGPSGPWPSSTPLLGSYLYDPIKNPFTQFV